MGYVFEINLTWRLIWGFIGNRFANWKTILAVGDQYKKQHQAFVDGLKKETQRHSWAKIHWRGGWSASYSYYY
jgi:cytochrome b